MIRLKDVKMKPKLIGLFVLTGLIPLIFLGLWSSKLIGDALIDRSYRQLEAVREIKKTQVQKFFDDCEAKLNTLVEAVTTLRQGRLEDILAAQFSEGQEDFFVGYIDQYGYTDLLLISPSGDIFYTVAHEADDGTNLLTGPYKDSGLGQLVQTVLQSQRFGIADFSQYKPRNQAPTAFIARPVLDAQDQVQLVVALALGIDPINAIMEQREGMGETGETYLVGPDMRMRSDSYRDPTHHSVEASFARPDQGSVETLAVEKALGGGSGAEILENYNGKRVLSAYTPMLIGDTTWVLVAEIEEGEITRPIMNLIWALIQGGFVIVGIVAFSSFFFAQSIARPLAKSVNFTRAVVNGDFSADIDIEQRDEIGMLAGALREMQTTIQRVLHTLDELIWAVQEGNLDARGDSDHFAGGWRALISGINSLIQTLVGHIDNIPIATKITDKDLNLRFVSRAGLSLLGGVQRMDVVGQKCSRIFHMETCGTDNCACTRVLGSQEQETGETKARLNGRDYYLKTIGVPIRNNKGEIIASMEILVDQTAIRNVLNNAGETAAVLLDSVQGLTVSAQEISTTSNGQAAAVKEIVSTMEDSDLLAKSIATKVEDVTGMTDTTKNIVKNGFAIIQDSLDKMNEIKVANADTIREMRALDTRIESIWDIVNMINVLADQTKIIAFNAELEAKSAGEAGRNFQIVANEIRRLADKTVASTNQIRAKIDEIQQSSDNLITTSEAGTIKIEEGWEHSKNLEQLFGQILDSADVSDKAADQIALSINQQVSAFEQILLTLKQIAQGIESFVVSTNATTSAAETLQDIANKLYAMIEEHTGQGGKEHE